MYFELMFERTTYQDICMVSRAWYLARVLLLLDVVEAVFFFLKKVS